MEWTRRPGGEDRLETDQVVKLPQPGSSTSSQPRPEGTAGGDPWGLRCPYPISLEQGHELEEPGPANDRLQRLLRIATSSRASDLHLVAGSAPVMRLHGELRPLSEMGDLTPEDTKSLFQAAMPDPGEQEQFWAEKELDFAYTAPGLGRFRMNASLQRGTVRLSIRVLSLTIPGLDELKLPPVLKEVVAQPRGLVLVCGPTGSGKSTTLAAMIDHLNRSSRKVIITIEDPIEFLHENRQCIVSQRQVGEDTRTFSAALRHALRQDPDVILVGELRDLETMALALTAAETGHLVLSTLHANSAVEAVERMVDVFPEGQQAQIRMQLSMSLASVIYQVLLPRADTPGRIAACEVLVATPAIRNLVRQGKAHEIMMYLEMGRAQGMQTLDQAISDLKARNLIGANEVARYGKSSGAGNGAHQPPPGASRSEAAEKRDPHGKELVAAGMPGQPL